MSQALVIHTLKASTSKRQRQEDQGFEDGLGYLENWAHETCLTPPKKKSNYSFSPENNPRQALMVLSRK